MSGSIGVIAQDNNRYTMFSVCLTRLKHPPNTKIDWGISNDIAGARNRLVERALEVGSEWLMFIDDDHVFAPDLLMRLLAHEKDVVSALYVRRAGDHTPLAFSHRSDDGLYAPIDLTKLPGEGLLKIYACGAGGLLIRSEVFRAISNVPNWFEMGRVKDRDWNASEDIIFCEKVHEAGFDIWLDLEAPMGHMGPAAVWPSYIDKEWCLGFSVAESTKLFAPIEKTAEAEAAPADAVKEVTHGR